MSSHYYITSFDPRLYENDPPPFQSPSDLAIDVADFIAHLKKKWPHIEIFRDSNSSMLVSWHIEHGLADLFDEKEYPFYGSLHKDHQTISFRWLNPFVLWYREYIPEIHSLYLFHESSWESLQLTNTTTMKDIEVL